MPCDQVIRQSIDFQRAQGHEALLEEALRLQGYEVTRQGAEIRFAGHGINGTYRNGQFETSGASRMNVDAVKREFGKQVVKKACRQYGWKFVDKGNKFEIHKKH